jgi:hypothetical protein
MTSQKPLNKAALKTLDKIKRACAKSADGWAGLGNFDIVHVRRLEARKLVTTDIVAWHVRA